VFQPPQVKPTIIAAPAPRTRPQPPYFIFASVSAFIDALRAIEAPLWLPRRIVSVRYRTFTVGVNRASAIQPQPEQRRTAVTAGSVCGALRSARASVKSTAAVSHGVSSMTALRWLRKR
jgi:hypothetical protein